MILLKQSTAATLRVGPFVDATDGVTPETGVTLGAADQAEILKATGGVVDISAATFAAVTSCDGWYDLSLSTSHTDTLGMLTVIIQDSSVCLPVFARAMVLPANAFDGLVSGSGVGVRADVQGWLGTAAATPTVAGVPEVDVTHWIGTAAATPTTGGVPEVDVTYLNGSNANLLNLNASASTIVRGTVDNTAHTPTTTEFESDDITEATADHYVGRLVIFTSGDVANQACRITAYTLETGRGHFTVTALTEAPANNVTFVIV